MSARSGRSILRALFMPNTMGTAEAKKIVTTDASTNVTNLTLTTPTINTPTVSNGSWAFPFLTNATISGPAPVAGGSTLAASGYAAGNTIKLDTASGTVVTLPAATGTGNKYKFIVTTTVTSNSHKILAASTSDSFQGNIATEDGGTMTGWNSAIATGNHSIAMNGTTTGGFQGDQFEIQDVATNVWQVVGVTKSTGIAATPFSTSAT